MLVDDLLLQNPLGRLGNVQFLHYPHQLVHRSEPFYFLLQFVHIHHLLTVEIMTLLPYLLELVQIFQQIVMDNHAYLLVFCRILYEFLFVLLYHLFQLLQLRRRWPLDLHLRFWLFGWRGEGSRFRSWQNWRSWVAVGDRTCQIDGFLHFFMEFVEHIVQFCGLLSGRNLAGFNDRTAVLPLLVVNLLFFLFLKPLHILLLKTSTRQFRRSGCSSPSQFIFEHGMTRQISGRLISLGNNLQIR